jgi:hypothetical protein
MEHLNFRKYNSTTNEVKFDLPTGHYPERPCLNTEGKSVIVRVNQFKVLEWPSDDIWQYDVRSLQARCEITSTREF